MIRNVLLLVPPLTNPESDGDPNPNRPDFETRRLVSPVEPATVAADLTRRGYEVAILDLGILTSGRYAELDRRLAACRADAVVIVQSILTFATAMDWDGKRAFDLVRRRLPAAVTVLTGAQPTNYPGDAVRAGLCDFSLKGEVDFTVGDLLDALGNGAPLDAIPGLAWRDGDGAVRISDRSPAVDVSTLPVPAYHLLDAEHRRRYTEVLERGKIRFPARSPRYRDLMTSRSCVLRCSFCSVAHLRGPQQKYRRKPIDLVLAEIEAALADGIEEIHFFDDLFAETEAQLLAFADALARRNLRFAWFVGQGMPLWPLTRDVLAALTETGMYRIICPFESGNDRVLRNVAGKVRSTVAHHEKVAGWVRELDLEVIGLFVIGMPGETRGEIRDTVQFAQDHPEIDYSVFSIATPMVGTKLMRTVTRAGRLDDPDKINRVIKRTVALYRTEEFREYEMGVIRTFDWDRINFSTPARRAKYARMVGMTLEELEGARQDARNVFSRFFPDYEGPRSFLELVDRPGLFPELAPVIPEQLYA
jgi:radical SAM superfamily enzyme YgiQ (UPF0313 family)